MLRPENDANPKSAEFYVSIKNRFKVMPLLKKQHNSTTLISINSKSVFSYSRNKDTVKNVTIDTMT